MTVSPFFKKLVQPFLKIAHVGIHIDGHKCQTVLQVYKSDSLMQTETREFEVPTEELGTELSAYIEKIQADNNYVYLSVPLLSLNQGSVTSCEDDLYRKLHIDLNEIARLCVEKRWSVYCSLFDIERWQHRFHRVGGLDFVFPTEVILDYIRDRYEKTGPCLFVINTRTAATLAIFEGGRLLYSAHFIYTEGGEEELFEEEEDEVDHLLEETSKEEIDEELEEVVELESIGEIDDLDQIEDLDDFSAETESETFEELGEEDTGMEEFLEEEQVAVEEGKEEENLKKDLLLFGFIKNSMEEFYHNPNYESRFVVQAVVLDTYGGSKSLSTYLHDELMIENEIRPLNIAELASDLSRMESKEL